MGSPARVLAMRTAAAPAASALRSLAENVQLPRVIKAIIPVRLFAGSAEQAVFNPFVVPVSTASGAVRSAVTDGNSPITAPYVFPWLVTVAPTKCGTELAPAVRARAAAPGDSIVPNPGPSLPAAIATTMLA